MKTTTIMLGIALLAGGAAVAQPKIELTKSYWTSQDFIDRFVGLYGFDGDIEPKISEEEASLLSGTIVPLMQQGQLDAAIQQLATAITPETSAALEFSLGSMFYEKGDYGRARQYYNQAIRKFGNFMRAYLIRGFIDVQEAKYDAAIEAFLKVIEFGKGDAATYGMLGFSFMNKEQFGAAESAYRDAILLDPENVDFRNGLIQVLYQSGRYNEAITLLEDAILAEPNKVAYWEMQTQAYIDTGAYDKAIGNLEMVKRLGLAKAPTMNLLGELYRSEGLYDSALASFKLSLAAEDKLPPKSYVNVAQTFLALGEFEESEEFVSEIEASGLELPSNLKIDVLNIKSQIYLNTNREAESAKLLQELIDMDPNNGKALILLANYNWRQDQFEKAAFLFERAAKIDEYAAEAYLDYGQMRADQGKFSEAAEMIREHLRIKSSGNVQRYLESLERAAAQAAANEAAAT